MAEIMLALALFLVILKLNINLTGKQETENDISK